MVSLEHGLAGGPDRRGLGAVPSLVAPGVWGRARP